MYNQVCKTYSPDAIDIMIRKNKSELEVFKDTRKRISLFGHKYIVTKRAKMLWDKWVTIATSIAVVSICYALYCIAWILLT